MKKEKFILDACCGPRFMWFNKQHPNTLYVDIRVREKGFDKKRPNREIKPDLVLDYRNLPFPDKSFKLVVMDPPHIIDSKVGRKETFSITKSFGSLHPHTWVKDIKKGFNECWRVLEDYGVLIFKWNETSVPRMKILRILEKEPLFGHPVKSRISTHWFCFMKIPKGSNDSLK